MKDRFLFLIFCFSAMGMFAQETDGFSLPNYAAKTPEAAAFLKYGEYPVNLSTGVPNISIPLYTIEIPGYSLPINLDYHASGIKINQEASWVGLGWNLNFGATIVLNVKGGIDENNSRIDDMPDLDEILDFYQDHPYAVNGGMIESEELDKSRIKDSYYFSSPTASGEFYVRDATTSPSDIVVYPPNAFKVEAINGIYDQPSSGRSRFKITDPAGNVYIFRTAEKSKHQNYGQIYNQGEYNSIWYVDEIRTPANNTINFSYEDDGITDDYATSQKIDIVKRGEYCNCGTSGIETEIHYEEIKPLTTMGNHTYTYVKRIKEISFNGGNSKIIFNRLNGREDFMSGYNSNLAKNYCTSYLNLIEIRQKDDQGTFQFVKGFDLNHSYFNPESDPNDYNMKRLKLTGVVDMLTGDGHSFVYSDMALPGKDSYSKDLYGYYNGANNSNLIVPQAVLEPYITTVGSAERGVSEQHAQAGVLKEIHYPTKGYTKFDFESNRSYGSTSETNHEVISISSGNYHPDFDMEPNPETGDLFFTESFTVNSGTTGILNWDAMNNAGGQYHQMLFHPEQFVKLIIKKHNADGTSIVYDSGMENGGPASSGFEEAVESYTGSVTLSSGNYTMYIQCHAQNIRMDAVLSFTDTESSIGGLLTGGLRVASIENYDHNDTLLTKKAYSYTMPEDSSKSSGRLVNTNSLNFISDLTKNFHGGTCTPPQGSSSVIPYLHYYNSRSVTSTSQSGEEGNTVSYEYVTEKDINLVDESAKGYALYKFSMGYDIVITDAVLFSRPWLRGKVLEKSYFKQAGGTDLLLRKEVNNYVDDNSNVANYKGFMMKRFETVDGFGENTANPLETPVHLTMDFCGDISTSALGMVQFIPVDINIPWNYLESTETTEYYYNSQNTLTGTFVTNTDYTYNNPVHLQLSKTTTTTSDGKTLETRLYYPGDAAVQGEPNVANLIAKNMISSPLKTQAYLNGSKLQEQKTKYKSWPSYDSGVNLILPEIIQGAKENDALENRIVFVQRDKAGNPAEVKLENGVSVCYIWAYNDSKVVAKIENATYAGISSTLLQDIKDASVTGTEQELISELNQLRLQLPNAMVTTYTYLPLIGISTITDPRGYKTTYELDNQSRLRFVKDQEDNILLENQYHYKN